MSMIITMAVLAAGSTWAQAKPAAVPDRQIPTMVLSELRVLQNRFESAMYVDCAPERCFPKGCSYGAHKVADQPEQRALPGLAEERGPGTGPAQEYLTLARCNFAHEGSLRPRDVKALVRRLQTKLSTGWTQVEVSAERLPPISDKLREAPKPAEPPPPPPEPEVEEEPPPPPPEPELWEAPIALRELWVALLPHFAWMIAIFLGTLAAMFLIWGWRRLGRLSAEVEVLMAQMSERPQPAAAGEASVDTRSEPPAAVAEDSTYVREQRAYWSDRFTGHDGVNPDVEALIASWLRADEMDLLAKAVLTFPDHLPAAFPGGGEFAEPKLRFSEYLKKVDPDQLPSDEAFYRGLERHALAASLGRHADTQGMASLRADFGAAGLVRTIRALPSRFGALLFAHAAVGDQLEASRLLSASKVADLAEQLLLSNRVSATEVDYLMSLVSAARSSEPLPKPPRTAEVSDLGSSFDAAGALSILLPYTDDSERVALLENARDGFGGAFPSWYEQILWPELVLKLGPRDRADLFFEADIKNLAAWLKTLGASSSQRLMEGVSSTLNDAVRASSEFASRDEQLERYQQGRLELAVALHRHLARSSIELESFVAS